MSAFYNEIDPFAAAWMRELIKHGLIAPGVVDERDIRDIRPDELTGYTQCHFFAGIGGWSYAARLAGIPDDRPLWTGSCPCQPFSAAGGRAGFADERHLWPAFFHLIEQCGPELVAGEQVSGRNVDPWFDLVQSDLEGMGYAFGLCPAPSASVGAPHIRDRAYWMAYASGQRCGGQHALLRPEAGGWQPASLQQASWGSSSLRLADTLRRGAGHASGNGLGSQATPYSGDRDLSRERLRLGIEGASGGMAISHRGERQRFADGEGSVGNGPPSGWIEGHGLTPTGSVVRFERPGPVNGFWGIADWLGCADGKWRPVEPGAFPLADGLPARVGRLRGYGNAINAEQAALFLEIALSAISERGLEVAA